MTASAKATRAAFLTPRGEGYPIHVIDDKVIIKTSSAATGGAFTVFEGETKPQSGPPLHLHRDQDESWYIIEGEYRFEVDGKEILGRAGDTIYAPRGTRHTFQNIGATTGRILTTVIPGGLDVFFAELEAIVPPGAAPDPARMIPLFEKHGLELHGPPLAARALP
jgi:quercetin dioxygenase-like cupin family protein